jgi:hypothetical protein
MNHWVVDYETNANCFLGVFEHYKTDEVKVFTIGKLRNDLIKFLEFLNQNIKNNEYHVTFNGLNFDGQITEYILKNKEYLLACSGEDAAKLIYEKAQDCINRSKNNEFQEWAPFKLSIKQIDVFKLNHWDSVAKRASLKWVQGSIRWENVKDNPLDHTSFVETIDDLKSMAAYCRNDVSSTKAIMQYCSKEIMLRYSLGKTYGVDLLSASEPKIAKEIFLYFLEKKLKIPKKDLKLLRTYRDIIHVKDILLPYLNFKTPEYKKLKTQFENLRLDPKNLKGQFKLEAKYKGCTTHFGAGGVHGAKKGIYLSDEDNIIMTSDVVSYYPNLIIRNGWSPKHLPKEAFCEQYEWFFNERIKIPKKDPTNYLYKIILNSVYGLSNEQDSFLYDPRLMLQVTMNGQLSLMLLNEMIIESIPGAIPLMQNTDGVEIQIPRKYLDRYLSVCKEWEELTKLQLEHDEYEKLVLFDVNNYIALNTSKEVSKEYWLESKKENPEFVYKEVDGKYYVGKTKTKGRFELRKALHKNHSYQVITEGIYNFFIHDIKPEDYLESNKNILDYCGLTRTNTDWVFKFKHVKNGEIVTSDLQKTLRYYNSISGGKILKLNKVDGRVQKVEAGKWMQTIFNKHVEKPFEDYGIDKRYYIQKIKNELLSLDKEIFITQTKLF